MYRSPSTNEECTPAQYVAELMITRKAQKDKKVLPYKFWNLSAYKKAFIKEVIKANALLKIYESRTIVAALSKAAWINSLYYPSLNDLLLAEEKQQDLEEKCQKPTLKVEDNTLSKPAIPFGEKSKISKLRELDG